MSVDVGSVKGSMYAGSWRSSLGASSSSLSSSPDLRDCAGEGSGASCAPDEGLMGVVGGSVASGLGDRGARVLRSAAACWRWTMYFEALFGRPFSPTSGR